MSELPKNTNLHRRNGRYYVRMRVPKNLVSHFKKDEVKYSLGTSNFQEARQKLPIEQLKIQESFDTARKELAFQTHLASAPEPSKTEIERAIALWNDTALQSDRLRLDDFRVAANEFEQEEAKEALREELAGLECGDDRGYGAAVSSAVNQILRKASLPQLTSLETKRWMYTLVHQCLIEQAYRELELLGGGYERQPYNTTSSLTAAAQQLTGAPDRRVSVSTLLVEFIDAKKADGVTSKSLVSYQLTINFANEFFGADKDLTTITSKDCRDFRDSISKLPSNAKKKYPQLTLIQAITVHTDDDTRLSATSVNRHINNLSGIFRFAVQEGYLNRNPAEYLKQVQASEGRSNERKPFDTEHLVRIFNAPLYKGCVDDERRYRQAGSNHPRRHRFWIPLISLYTGMRLNEICQLYADDIRYDSDIAYFRVTANTQRDQRLKNKQSERNIPIHSQLRSAGFLDYVEVIRRGGYTRLFPDMSQSAEGSYSANFTKWFNKFLQSTDAKQATLCFHSFRHNFRDALRAARIDREISAQLGGWKVSESVMDTYGQGHTLSQLNSALQTIEYLGLDLRHLHN